MGSSCLPWDRTCGKLTSRSDEIDDFPERLLTINNQRFLKGNKMLTRIDEKIQQIFRRVKGVTVLPSVVQVMGLLLSFGLPVAILAGSYIIGPCSWYSSVLSIEVIGSSTPSLGDWFTMVSSSIAFVLGMCIVLSRYGWVSVPFRDDAFVRLFFLCVGMVGAIVFGIDGDIYRTVLHTGYILYVVGSYMWEAELKA